jgi:predicted transcriptional regulator
MANAAIRVRDVFRTAQQPLTLADINTALPDLKPSEVSMALCYFRKQRYISREQIKNEKNKGRKQVWLYTFHDVKLPKPVEATNV